MKNSFVIAAFHYVKPHRTANPHQVFFLHDKNQIIKKKTEIEMNLFHLNEVEASFLGLMGNIFVHG